MIIKNIGNILEEVKSGVIVHGCNAQGVMGGGFALQLKKTYPKAYKEYAKECELQDYRKGLLGQVIYSHVANHLWIANAITQYSYGTEVRHVDYEAVVKCFEDIKIVFHPDISINFPMIGAGLGGGNWKIISTIIEETINDRDVYLWVL